MKKLLFTIGCIITAFAGNAQQSAPLPVEVFVGNKRFVFSTVTIKQFTEKSRFGFLSVISYAAGYDNNLQDQDFISVANINYKIGKGFSAVAGLSLNGTSGFHGTTGIQYTYQSPKMLLVVLPVMSIRKTYNFEPLALIEYKPKLTTALRLYTKAQVYYNHDTKDNLHARSYIHLRLGLTKGMFTYGLGASEEYYGPAKLLKENYGAFVRAVFK